MIGLDTNVLVRDLVEDDDAQAARAASIIEGAAERDEKRFVASIVLCEVVWVLRAAHRKDRHEIARVLAALLRTAQLVGP